MSPKWRLILEITNVNVKIIDHIIQLDDDDAYFDIQLPFIKIEKNVSKGNNARHFPQGEKCININDMKISDQNTTVISCIRVFDSGTVTIQSISNIDSEYLNIYTDGDACVKFDMKFIVLDQIFIIAKHQTNVIGNKVSTNFLDIASCDNANVTGFRCCYKIDLETLGSGKINISHKDDANIIQKGDNIICTKY